MIHQHILAAPRPGMSETEFQDYWRFVHALKFARKIPQIRKYKVDSRINIDNQPQELNFSGIGEIWIDDEKAQQDSLITPEFLQGAVLDEPNWAASWQTLVIDTESVELLDPKIPDDQEFPEYKTLLFMKRKRGMDIDSFRDSYSTNYSNKLKEIENLNKITCCLAKKKFYSGVTGSEPAWDAITHLSFDNLLSLKKFSQTEAFKTLLDPSSQELTDPWGLVTSSVRSEYIIGPQLRPY